MAVSLDSWPHGLDGSAGPAQENRYVTMNDMDMTIKIDTLPYFLSVVLFDSVDSVDSATYLTPYLCRHPNV